MALDFMNAQAVLRYIPLCLAQADPEHDWVFNDGWHTPFAALLRAQTAHRRLAAAAHKSGDIPAADVDRLAGDIAAAREKLAATTITPALILEHGALTGPARRRLLGLNDQLQHTPLARVDDGRNARWVVLDVDALTDGANANTPSPLYWVLATSSPVASQYCGGRLVQVLPVTATVADLAKGPLRAGWSVATPRATDGPDVADVAARLWAGNARPGQEASPLSSLARVLPVAREVATDRRARAS